MRSLVRVQVSPFRSPGLSRASVVPEGPGELRDEVPVGGYARSMTDAAQFIFDQALKLSHKERATLAADLLASLDGGVDSQEEVDAAWAVEIRRRVERVRSGEPGIPWESVQAEIKQRLKERRGG